MVNKLVLLCFCITAAIAQYDGNQREHRRFSPMGGQNFLPHHIERVTGIIHLQPYDRPSMFVHPFHNRRIIEPNQQYDRHGRPSMDPNIPYDNYAPHEPHAWQGNRGRRPTQIEYNYNNDRSHVKFPGQSSNQLPYPNEQAGNQQGDVKFPTALPPLSPNGAEPGPVFTPPLMDDVKHSESSLPLQPLSPNGAESGPAFTPPPADDVKLSEPGTLQPLSPSGIEPGPAFATNDINHPGPGTLPPLSPNGSESGPAFTPSSTEFGRYPDPGMLPPLSPSGLEPGPAFVTDDVKHPNPETLPPLSPNGSESGPAFTPSSTEFGKYPDPGMLPPLSPSGLEPGPAFAMDDVKHPSPGTLSPLSPNGSESGPAFTPSSTEGEKYPDPGMLPPLSPSGVEPGPAFATDDVKHPGPGTLPPLSPNGSESGPAFTPSLTEGGKYPDPGTLPPLSPNGSESGPAFAPLSPSGLEPGPAFTPTLSPLSPNGSELGPVFTPPKSTLPPLTPAAVPPSENGPAFSKLPEIGTTLPPLTPVPTSEYRGSFNFNPVSSFNAPCVLDGLRGSCIPLLACEDFTRLLREVQTNPQVVQLLRRAHCGFEGNNPKVCCPARSIPTEPPVYSPATQAPTFAPTTVPAPRKADDTDASDYVDRLPQPPMCGSSNATLTRVVGGVSAKLGDFPWMALLGFQKRGSTSWSCGGSLVSKKHVLTAAHCIFGHEKTLYVVRLGEQDLSRDDEGATPVDILIKKAIMHENYDRASVSNDIGVLYLEREAPFTDLIRPICLPSSRELRANTFENYNPIVAGWGSISYDGPSASVLQVVQLPVVGNRNCKEIFKAYKQISIDERVLCAGLKKGGKDACQGDSGGPLMQPIWNSKDYTTHFYQIGVVSFGKKCAEPGFPGVYTRVTTFIPWIEEKLLGPNARNQQ